MNIAHRPHARALRAGRWSERNRIYVITCVTWRRAPTFLDLYAGRAVVAALEFQQSKDRADTLAYVVMPDHVHWMLRLRAGASLSRVVHSVRSFSARQINTQRSSAGRRVWQPGFHDRAVRSDEALAPIARYVVANPVRAGLVRRIGDYPLWDAIWLS